MATKSETLYARKIFLGANIIFAILGYIFLVGVVLNLQTKEYSAIGIFAVLLIIFAYLGLFSRFKNDDFMTIIFSACLLIIFFVEMSIALTDTATFRTGQLKKSFLKRMRSEKELDQVYIDNFQIKHKCCGWDGPADWTAFGLLIPASCCAKNKKYRKFIDSCTSVATEVHFSGCGKKYYEKHSYNILQKSNITRTKKKRTKSTNALTEEQITGPKKIHAEHKVIESDKDSNDVFFRFSFGQEDDVTPTASTDWDNINNTDSVEVTSEAMNEYIDKELDLSSDLDGPTIANNGTENESDYEYEEDDYEEVYENDKKDPSKADAPAHVSGAGSYKSSIPAILQANLLG